MRNVCEMKTVSLLDVASYLPKTRVSADFYTDCPGADGNLRDHPMFRPPAYRHHIAPDESSVDMIEQAVQPLIARHGKAAIRDVDVLLVHTFLPDLPFTGCGTEVVRRLGCRPEWLIDVHNSGCAAFVYMMKLARQIIATTDARSALICTVQNMAGQWFVQPDVRKLAQAAIPGDGCGVGYLTDSEQSPVLSVECQHIGEYAGAMRVALDDGRKYWEPGESQVRIHFTEQGLGKVMKRGSRLIPEAVTKVCADIGVVPSAIDALITNQPNRTFLRNWREALQLSPEQHLDTFEMYGNLFGAAVPVTLDQAVQEGKLTDGSLLVLGGFAHAGDFAGAAAIRWNGRR